MKNSSHQITQRRVSLHVKSQVRFVSREQYQQESSPGHFVQVSDVREDGTVFWFSDLIKGQTSQGKLMKEGNASEAEVQLRADEIMEQQQEASWPCHC